MKHQETIFGRQQVKYASELLGRAGVTFFTKVLLILLLCFIPGKDFFGSFQIQAFSPGLTNFQQFFSLRYSQIFEL